MQEENPQKYSDQESDLETGKSAETSRKFAFQALDLPELPETGIVVRKIGKFYELLGRLGKEEKSLVGAIKILEFFNSIHLPVLPDDEWGKDIFHKPHLLIAGGFVRDIVMGKTPKDIDFATNMEHATLRRYFDHYFSKELKDNLITVNTTGTRYKVMRVQFRGDEGVVKEEYEIASFREEGDYQDGRRPNYVRAVKHAGIDASRRDLTVNALFYNPFSGNVIDYVGGLKDIEARVLRFVGNPEKRITEDYIRMLRYIRFLVRTGFTEDLSAKEAILSNAEKINLLPGEPLRDELGKMLMEERPGFIVRAIYEYGLLKYLLPDIAALRDCLQGPPYHMEGDVLTHTIMTMETLPKNASLNLRWAAMLHDVSKPATRAVEHTGEVDKVSFLGHAEHGAIRLSQILSRFRFAEVDLRHIRTIVENHIRMFSFPDMRQGKAREMVELPEFEDLIELAIADSRSSVPSDPKFKEENERMIAAIRERFKKFREFKEAHESELVEVEKAVNGTVIIERYKVRWGREPVRGEIGLLKQKVLGQIRDQNVTNPEEALRILNEVVEDGLPSK